MSERVEQMISDLESCSSWEGRYKYIIKKGKAMPPVDDDQKLDKFIVEGCISQAWLIPELKDKKVFFSADSDASIVKGIMAILLEAYNGLSPDEILALDPVFLKEAGIVDHLSMNRRNGLSNFVKQIKLYAVAYKATMS